MSTNNRKEYRIVEYNLYNGKEVICKFFNKDEAESTAYALNRTYNDPVLKYKVVEYDPTQEEKEIYFNFGNDQNKDEETY